MSHTLSRGAAAAAVLLVPALAAADLDLPIVNGAKVAAGFDPAAEVETYRIRVPRGASLTVKSKAAKGGAAPRFALLPSVGEGGLGTVVEAGTKATLSKFSVETGGDHRLVFTSRDGATAGGYSFTCSWKSAASFPIARDLPAASDVQSFVFGADAGAKVTIELKASRGSPALPRLVSLRAPGGTVTDLGAADPAGPLDRAGPIVLPQTGDWTVSFDNGGEAGAVTGAVRLKVPKPRKASIDVSARALGTDGTAFGQIVGRDGADVVVPDTGGGGGAFDITGSAVSVPPGALAAPTAIVVGTAPDLLTKGPDDPVGAAVSFGPDGLAFREGDDGEPVRISIPVDLGLVGDALDDVRVYVRDAKGKVRLVDPPYDFESRPGFVTFPTSHFSAYQAVLPGVGGGTSTLFTAAVVPSPRDVALALDTGANRLYYVATGNEVRAVSLDVEEDELVLEPFAGGGTSTDDGTDRSNFDFQGPVTAVASSPDAVFVGTATRVFRVDASSGQVTRILGDGVADDTGDDGPAVAARIRSCADLLVDSFGDLLVVDRDSARVRVVVASQDVFPFAGTGVQSTVAVDGAAPTSAGLLQPSGITESENVTGIYFVAELSRVRTILPAAATTQVLAGDPAGSRSCWTLGTNGTSARFSSLSSIAFDFFGSSVVVADDDCHSIYTVGTFGGTVAQVAGTTGIAGFTPDFGQVGGTVRIDTPRGVLVFGTVLVFADSGNDLVRTLILPTDT